jgi:hypothetical protein
LTVAFAGKTTAWTTDEIAALPHQDFTAFDAHDKKTHQYSGLPMHDLLVMAPARCGW